MTLVAGIDIGSTYTKCTVLDREEKVVGKAMLPTGFRLAEAAEKALDEALREAGALREDLGYTVATGFGRHQNEISDVQVTDLTASARGVAHFFPKTQTILDVGGQTMKASRLTDNAKVKSFRLNDKCAAGTGAFLEKTARYMGFSTEEIGPLVSTSKEAVSISGVCAVFAESEVINQLSEGSAPADIMRGAMVSLVGRSLQLMKRVKMEPEFTLIGGIMRFPAMVEIVKEELAMDVNVPEGDLVQFTSAFGAALLGRKRVEKRKSEGATSGV